MYWDIRQYINEKAESDGWGKSVVTNSARFIESERPNIKGDSAQNIWRMKQFYETYRNNKKLSELLREINWTNNLTIMSRVKTDEAREFYLLLCKRNKYSSHELERQIDSMLFERTMISDERNKIFISKNAGLAALRDNYILEFLDIPENYKEKELRKSMYSQY